MKKPNLYIGGPEDFFPEYYPRSNHLTGGDTVFNDFQRNPNSQSGHANNYPTPSSTQMRYNKSRLGNNTLQHMIEQSRSMVNKSHDNLMGRVQFAGQKKLKNRAATKVNEPLNKTIN